MLKKLTVHVEMSHISHIIQYEFNQCCRTTTTHPDLLRVAVTKYTLWPPKLHYLNNPLERENARGEARLSRFAK